MKLLLLIFCILFVCISCKKSKGDAGNAVYGVYVYYVDSAGMPVFSQIDDGKNGYWIDSVLAYDFEGGVRNLLDCFEGQAGRLSNKFVNDTKYLRLQICPNTDVINRYSTTLIHLKNADDDTVRLHLTENTLGPSTGVDSIWYNGVLKYYQDSVVAIVVSK